MCFLHKPIMVTARPAGRELKRKVRELLRSEDLAGVLESICLLPPRRVVNPLIGFFNSPDRHIKWAAVTAMGAVVAKLADEDMEAGRVIMRRLMWSLNDESGGIGWGCPEAMGEILACHEGLAREFATILISYTRKDANYLEHEMLQRGLLWGIGRLSQARPRLVTAAGLHLLPYLKAGDASVRGHAAWVAGILGLQEARPELEALKGDEADFEIYIDRALTIWQVKEAAVRALGRLSSRE